MTAIVLAGDRVSDDPVARAVGIPYKALVPVGGGLSRNASYRAQISGRRGLWIQPVRVPDARGRSLVGFWGARLKGSTQETDPAHIETGMGSCPGVVLRVVLPYIRLSPDSYSVWTSRSTW